MTKLPQHGGFNLNLEAEMRAELLAEFTEFEFSQVCQRQDGSIYGTAGQCRKGTEVNGRPDKAKSEKPQGGAAERMKKAYDGMVGVDLSKLKGVPIESAKSLSISSTGSSAPGLELTRAQDRLKELVKRENMLRDKAERFRGPSGEIATRDVSAHDKLYNSAARVADLRLQAQQEVSRELDKRALGRTQINPGVNPRVAELKQELIDLKARQTPILRRIDELRPYDPAQGVYKVPSVERDVMSLEKAIRANGVIIGARGDLEGKIKRLEFDDRNTQLQQVQREVRSKYLELQAADKVLQQEVAEKGGFMVGSRVAIAGEGRNRLAKEYNDLRSQYDKLAKEEEGIKKLASEWRKADVIAAAGGGTNKPSPVAQRSIARPSMVEYKKGTSDLAKEIKRMEDAGAPKSDVAAMKVLLSARVQVGKEGLAMKRGIDSLEAKASVDTNAHRTNMRVLVRINKERELIMNRLLKAKLATNDPDKQAKFQAEFDRIFKERANLAKVIGAEFDAFRARKAASKKMAQALIANPTQGAKVTDLLAKKAKQDALVEGGNAKVAAIDSSIKRLNDKINQNDKAQGEVYQKIEQYEALIKGAKSPTEKQLLEGARIRRGVGVSLNGHINQADVLNKQLNNLYIARAQENAKLNKAVVRQLSIDNKLDALIFSVKSGEARSLPSTKTLRARNDVFFQDREISKRIKEKAADVEVLAANRPNYNWAVGEGSGSKALGTPGSFGSAFKVGGPPPGTVKVGQIGQNEAEAMARAHAVGVGPELYKAVRIGDSTKTSYGVNTAAGKIAYSYVSGKPVGVPSSAFDNKPVPLDVREKIWAARATLHRGGVAHEDMHPGNVIVDKNGKVNFIDFGLSKVGNKFALAEALGVATVPGENGQGKWGSSGDEQVARWGQFGKSKDGKVPTNLMRVLENRNKVKSSMLADGFSQSEIREFMNGRNFRKGSDHFGQGGWGRMSEGLAAKYIDALYDGVS